jgi:hypothetical protein
MATVMDLRISANNLFHHRFCTMGLEMGRCLLLYFQMRSLSFTGINESPSICPQEKPRFPIPLLIA